MQTIETSYKILKDLIDNYLYAIKDVPMDECCDMDEVADLECQIREMIDA
jgi:hypothetical protein